MLLFGLVLGSIGIGYFVYGRRQDHIVARYTGLALMLFPYVVSDPVLMVVIGVLLMLLPRFVRL
ncbi:MAG: hypothetical protein CL581_09820 [Alteromonadaceae bacterium]|nr:hypothetical protein [Alteromonadaceae bacterium]MBH86141.1 hypothetical protein [Alteromonadaceae bacterium]|tara:strand:+ start:87 stop:278 length:192 start_codon:yes stop_codon:yes gene_type:complete